MAALRARRDVNAITRSKDADLPGDFQMKLALKNYPLMPPLAPSVLTELGKELHQAHLMSIAEDRFCPTPRDGALPFRLLKLDSLPTNHRFTGGTNFGSSQKTTSSSNVPSERSVRLTKAGAKCL